MSSPDSFDWQISHGVYSASQSPAIMSNMGQADLQAEGRPGPSTEPSSNSSRSPLSRLGLGFLESLGEGKKANREGQTPKKRGPKRDSKPALTRRQELNRQAQRTHRERKETYIKSLEEQCMQLKEVYEESFQEKQAVLEENKKLKELLRMNGIQYSSREQSATGGYPTHPNSTSSTSRSASAYGYGGWDQQRFSPSGVQGSLGNSPSVGASGYYSDQGTGISQPSLLDSHGGLQGQSQQQPSAGPAASTQNPILGDFQLGVDFVLALEATCMDHLQYMCVRSNQDPEQPPSGHALMMSCPPYSHIDNHPEVPYPHKTLSLPGSELMRLFQLSQNLPLEGEITPVMALGMIFNHPRFGELTVQDFNAIKVELRMKTRCYGFGAVLEEFELQDALNNVLATKVDTSASYG
ncbi:MAG: hypothetical protein LQ340_004893 [Diploschistes diacapsis]|nr:MAG: hypothetical protein LQ340_004893 [Diploschistes diacapsis]